MSTRRIISSFITTISLRAKVVSDQFEDVGQSYAATVGFQGSRLITVFFLNTSQRARWGRKVETPLQARWAVGDST